MEKRQPLDLEMLVKFSQYYRGVQAAYGKRGGKSKSPAKVNASRLNGRKGGRPRKVIKPPSMPTVAPQAPQATVSPQGSSAPEACANPQMSPKSRQKRRRPIPVPSPSKPAKRSQATVVTHSRPIPTGVELLAQSMRALGMDPP